MKKYLLSLLCLILSVSAYADLKVEGFGLEINNLLGRTNYKEDRNHEPYAVLLVNLPIRGAVFQGPDVDSDYRFNGSTYTIYMANGAKSIEISVDGQPKLNIRFSDFGEEYRQLKGQNTYYLDIIESGQSETGMRVNIYTSVSDAKVIVDGKDVGTSPVFKVWLTNGPHNIKAIKDKYEGTREVNINSRNVAAGDQNIHIQMEDMTPKYGRVRVTTLKDAELLIDGQSMGYGEWVGDLQAGEHTAEARMGNADPSPTPFQVKAGQMEETIVANPPRIWEGTLQAYIKPYDATLAIDGEIYPADGRISLPVGTHNMSVSRSGYESQQKVITINRNQKTEERINLARIYYLKKNGMYFGGAYTIGTFSGATGLVGVVFSNIDVQLSYSFGLSESAEVNFYENNAGNDVFRGCAKFKANSFSAKIGYQIPLSMKLAIVPQVGFTANTLKGTILNGVMQGDGAVSNCASVGAKMVFSPARHFCLFVAPEFDVAVKNDKIYDTIADAAGFSKGGFYCHAGLLINF